ncbi:MAG: FtsW/RodA/SpoVE family cell cycle protein [Tannerellaceae bacterium]|jgi:cell division protein FtsW|nr:FtsW/RodA/SpoVE family cell cycle protein [Tannerellaceae bacterium]
MNLANKLFKGDRVIWIIFLSLILISAVEVFSATSTLAYKRANHWDPIAMHASFLLFGFILILILHHIPYKLFPGLIILLPFSALLLLATPFLGESTNDAHRWIGLFGFKFQPSEFGKLSCIVFVAFLLSKRQKFTDSQVFKWICFGMIPICLLIFPENLSTAAMLFVVCCLLMFIGGIPFVKLAKLIGLCLLAGLVLAAVLVVVPDKYLEPVSRAPTWKKRIVKFMHKSEEANGDTYVINDDNYQVSHANIAIARGGLFGKLPGHGQQRDFLPQAYSDFIYAIIIEELGIAGGLIVLFLYVVLMWRVGMIARRCDKLFPKFLVLGCGLLIVVQAFTNMAVAVGLFPVTGQPMPLVSRGGTSTVLSCVYFGIILSISRFGAGIGNEDEDEEEDEEIVNSEQLIVNSEQLTVDSEQLAVDGEQLAVDNEQ